MSSSRVVIEAGLKEVLTATDGDADAAPHIEVGIGDGGDASEALRATGDPFNGTGTGTIGAGDRLGAMMASGEFIALVDPGGPVSAGVVAAALACLIVVD
jgi:hypothetical protein